MLEKLFKLDANGTNVSRELAAGTTTFLTMAYIIFVNPNILSATKLWRYSNKPSLKSMNILQAINESPAL